MTERRATKESSTTEERTTQEKANTRTRERREQTEAGAVKQAYVFDVSQFPGSPFFLVSRISKFQFSRFLAKLKLRISKFFTLMSFQFLKNFGKREAARESKKMENQEIEKRQKNVFA